jgi:hypothetical protein
MPFFFILGFVQTSLRQDEHNPLPYQQKFDKGCNGISASVGVNVLYDRIIAGRSGVN